MIRRFRMAMDIRGVLAAVAAALLLSFASGAPAAEASRFNFDLPADTLERSLKRFAVQSGVQVLAAADDLAPEVRTQPVSGRMTSRQALEAMLAGTGLTVVADPKTGAFAMRRAPASTVAQVQSSAAPASRPNIVLIVADDLGWSDVGYRQGKTAGLHETPNIDRLAAEGMRLDRFYPGAANCAPARACLMSGMYTPRHHVYLAGGWTSNRVDVTRMRWKVPTFGQDESFNTFRVNINTLDPHWTSLAELLRTAGYVTARIGNWHLGRDLQGFDVVTSDGTPGNHSKESYYNDNDVTDRLTAAAVHFLEKHRDRPMFLYLAHYEPHGPLGAREDRIAYYRKKFARLGNTECNPIYAAMVEQVDISTGRVLAALERLGLERNTIVIFTSDNGGGIDLTRTPSNHPLKAYKGTYYEGGIRTPCVVRWPAVVKPGTRTDYPVNGVDLMPTFAAIAGVPPPRNQPVDGISILPLLQGREMPADRRMFFHFPLYLGGSPLPIYGGTDIVWRAVPLTVIVRGDWKLIHYYEYDRDELFNLRDDLAEEHDLAAERPDLVAELKAEMREWVERVNAPIPRMPNDKFRLPGRPVTAR